MELIIDWRKSRRSAQNGGACVEVGVTDNATR